MAWPSIIQYRRKGDDTLLDAFPIGVESDKYERMEYHPDVFVQEIRDKLTEADEECESLRGEISEME